LNKTYAILAKTKIGRMSRTTVPEEVRDFLRVKEGDEIVWIQEGDKVIVDRARKEVKNDEQAD